MFSYSDWLYERSERTDLPNFVVVCVMLGLLTLAAIAFGFPAFSALAHGGGWSGTFTLGKTTQPTVHRIAPWLLGSLLVFVIFLTGLLHVVIIVRRRGLDEL